MRVEIRNLSKTFDAYKALDGVSLDMREGEFCALLGPSGSGKTTLLRIIAGLEFPDCGQVRFAGDDPQEIHRRQRFEEAMRFGGEVELTRTTSQKPPCRAPPGWGWSASR